MKRTPRMNKWATVDLTLHDTRLDYWMRHHKLDFNSPHSEEIWKLLQKLKSLKREIDERNERLKEMEEELERFQPFGPKVVEMLRSENGEIFTNKG